MINLKTLMKSALVGAVIAMAPLAANAVTVTQTGVVGDPFGATGVIDVLTGASFNAVFDDVDTAGNAWFDLNNNHASTAAVTFTVTTIAQCVNACGFTGGAFIDLDGDGIFDGAPEVSVAQNQSITTQFTFLIAAGGTQFFDFYYGDPYGTATLHPDFDFTVEATLVPVPAAGLLLLTALGGLGVARRRRKAA